MNQQIVSANISSAISSLYDEYSGLLYGYIYEVVKDRKIAEQYLVSVFNELPQHLHIILRPGINTYQRLQLLARKTLSAYFETIPSCNTPEDFKKRLHTRPNRFLDRMTEEQQLVFCSVHYSGKSISDLSVEMKKPEDVIRKILQQAFAIIRSAA